MTEESLLRDTMRADAASVEPTTDLAEQIIAEAMDATVVRRLRPTGPAGWRNWVLPAVAAITVAVLVGAVLLAREMIHSTDKTAQPGPTMSQPAPTPSPSSSNDKISPAPSRGTSAIKPPSTPVQVGPVGGPVPVGFHAVDLTWISTTQGWAIGTAPCANAPCTSMVRTRDGGASWVGIHAPAAELDQDHGCNGLCVKNVRFASALVGYAFGTNALFMTTDGGDSWVRQSGGADALETSNGTALRVTGQAPGCVPGCTYRVQRSDIGSSSWAAVAIPQIDAAGDGVTLVRSGHLAALEVIGNPAGGASNERSALLTSGDDGAHWLARGEPCPQTGSSSAGNEVDSRSLTSAADGSLTVLCSLRGVSTAAFTATSTDSGDSFRAAPRSLGKDTAAIGAASAQVLFAVQADGLYRSNDGGGHWQRALVDTSISGNGRDGAPFIGFESVSTGRYLSADGSSLYTTTDAGLHWSRSKF
jgi:photosystem II stability/assembly factor-like uncharacterized protein